MIKEGKKQIFTSDSKKKNKYLDPLLQIVIEVKQRENIVANISSSLKTKEKTSFSIN